METHHLLTWPGLAEAEVCAAQAVQRRCFASPVAKLPHTSSTRAAALTGRLT
jgi:hypothetical protein